MLTELVSGVVLASTLLAPLPDAPTDTSTVTIPLVREELGVWYTLYVNQECPTEHPYVHSDTWVGSLPEHVTFTANPDGDRAGDPAVKLIGFMTNWNFSNRYVSIDLKCTSNPRDAAKVPMSGP